MKKANFYKIVLLCITVMLLAQSGTTACKASAKTDTTAKKGITIQIGKKQQQVKTLEGSFIKKQGKQYFKKQNGKLAKKQFFAQGKKIFYVNKNGEVLHGWNKIKEHYYFFSPNAGKLIYNTTINRIKITKKGIAEETTQNIDIVKVYLEAQKVVRSVSKSTDSKSTKLYNCYLWMKKFPYKRFRTMKAARSSHPNDWDIVFANDIFKTHSGCCASEACAFAYIAKVCGYKDVTICSDTEHAWVDIGGKLYDPLFAEAKSFSKNYNANYTDYRKNPGYKKKI